MADKFSLKLYVTGQTANSEKAIRNLQEILEKDFDGQYQLEIIDVLKHPQMAEEDKILATPALIKNLPPPVRKIIGDLADKEQVLLGLNLSAKKIGRINNGQEI